jgi:RND family efflux transporter MFP subunit
MKNNLRYCKPLVGFCAGASLLVLIASCNRQAPAEKDSAQKKEDAKKSASEAPHKLVKMTFTHKIDSPGEIQADETTRIFAKITGYVKVFNKDIGDRIKPGDILAELSVPEYDEELLEKQARVIQAQAERDRAKNLHAAAEANVKFADAKVNEAIAAKPKAIADRELAESTYDRLKKSASVVSDQAIAETKLGLESANAAVAEVETKIKSAEAWHAKSVADRKTEFTDIAVAEARLKVAEAAARNMKVIVNYAKLPAPYKGVVVQRNVDLGDLVQSSASGSKGEPIFIVARTDPVRIYVDVPENDAVLIEDKKTKATVRVQALKGEEFQGTVQRSSFALDPKGRILRTEIDLSNPDGRLRPGMYAYATITVVHKDVWAVPASAIVTKDHQTFCRLMVDGKATLTPVLVGLRDSQFIEVTKKRTTNAESGWQDFTGKEELAPGQ